MHLSPEDFKCPVCQQTDRVDKISVVHAAGTSTGMYSGGTVGIGVAGGIVGVGAAQTSLTGVNQTHLSRRLAPPPPPPPPSSGWGCLPTGLLIFLALTAFVGLVSITDSDTTARLIAGAVTVLSIAGFVGIIMMMQPKIRAKKAEHAQQIARWQQAYMNWDCLYYCGRNDIVFLPGIPGSSVSAHEIYKLL